MKAFNREITLARAIIDIGLLITLLTISGCASHTAHKKIPDNMMGFNTSKCKVLGKHVGKYSSVMVRKDCLRKGLTEVTIFLHGVKSVEGQPRKLVMWVAKMGIIEATKHVIKILGFRPALSAMAITKYKGTPCYVFAVVGAAPE